VAGAIAGSLLLFVFPHQDSPRRADAVVVLSGSLRGRLPTGLALMRRKVAPTLVISGGFEPKYRLAAPYCRGRVHPSFRVVCFDPRPNSTRGEAQQVARLARAHGWRTIVVVSSTYHLFRTGILFRRCTPARVELVGWDPPPLSWAKGVVSEWAKLAVALALRRAC
jgi:uncharacterized SAM-binding protein YcdF (DUF218 family)